MYPFTRNIFGLEFNLSGPVCIFNSFLSSPSTYTLFVIGYKPDLSKKVNPAHFNSELLVGRYVPNLTAEPFQITKAYAEKIHNQTMSPKLSKILKNWDEENWGAVESRKKLGYAMYVVLSPLFPFEFFSLNMSNLDQ